MSYAKAQFLYVCKASESEKTRRIGRDILERSLVKIGITATPNRRARQLGDVRLLALSKRPFAYARSYEARWHHFLRGNLLPGTREWFLIPRGFEDCIAVHIHEMIDPEILVFRLSVSLANA